MNKKKIAAYILMCIMTVGIFCTTVQPVYAGNGTVSVSVSASSVTTGGTVSVTIGISADEAIGYGVAVSYDTSVLEYQGGGDGGGSGTVTILNEGDGSTAAYSRTLTFTAVGTGSTAISTSEFAGGLFGYATGDMTTSYGSATVTVSAPQANDNTAGGGEEPATSTTLAGSSDNTLKSLEISPGTLTPAFKSGTTSYTVNLPEDTKAIVVSAVPNDSKAKVAVSHNNDLEPGANKTYIVVTAENGTQRTYVLNVNCGETPGTGTDDTEESEGKKLQIDGKDYIPATQAQMAEVSIPEGFSASELEYEGEKLTAYVSSNQLLTILYLLDTEGAGGWFRYQEDKQIFTPYLEFQAAVNRYVIVTPDETVSIPAGYTEIETEIQGQHVTAYAKEGNEEFLLVYAVNLNGEAGFYLYDTVEGTYQRYTESNLTEQEPKTEEASSTETVLVTGQEQNKHLRILVYVVSGLCVLLLGMLIAIASEYKKKVLMQDVRVEGIEVAEHAGEAEQKEETAESQEFTDEDM